MHEGEPREPIQHEASPERVPQIIKPEQKPNVSEASVLPEPEAVITPEPHGDTPTETLPPQEANEPELEDNEKPRWSEEVAQLAIDLRIPEGLAEGERIKEALQNILEAGNITGEDIRELIPQGIRFLPDTPLPPEYQPTPDSTELKYIGGADFRHGTLNIYKEFKNNPDPTHVIAHELGELMQRRLVVAGQETDNPTTTTLVNYDSFVKQLANWQSEWDDPFVRSQAGRSHHLRERLADLTADAIRVKDLTSETAGRELLALRLPRLSNRAELQAMLDTNDPLIEPMIEEANRFCAFLHQELADKKPLLTTCAVEGESDDQTGEDLLQLYDMEGRSYGQPYTEQGQHMVPNKLSVNRAIDFFFFAGAPPG